MRKMLLCSFSVNEYICEKTIYRKQNQDGNRFSLTMKNKRKYKTYLHVQIVFNLV